MGVRKITFFARPFIVLTNSIGFYKIPFCGRKVL